ncbi:hypothetical protein Dda3937_04571 [Dickeya dadantii 3937]|uniref:Uncharacterized protein n=1 Tax=Dickeya dadantii (strain 3937) TaxID=198628 RepID=E0SAV2_DICD3|nr:hypothetical protein Dda3937_04571 [Dickeya dadantii 3937]
MGRWHRLAPTRCPLPRSIPLIGLLASTRPRRLVGAFFLPCIFCYVTVRRPTASLFAVSYSYCAPVVVRHGYYRIECDRAQKMC